VKRIVRFEVLRVEALTISVFWTVMLCRPVNSCHHSERS